MSISATVKHLSKSHLSKQQGILSFTPAAVERIKQLYAAQRDEQKQFLKIKLNTKGCSGSSYALDWVPSASKWDERIAVTASTSLLVDNKALLSILGSQMDYAEDKLSAGFVFYNPNIKETCGCGLSFLI